MKTSDLLYKLHHLSCPRSQAWDMGEWEVPCRCPHFWPRRVCVLCWRPPKQHSKWCPTRPNSRELHDALST